MIANALLSAFALVVFQIVAYGAYTNGDILVLIVYEVLALLALFALYFAVKTLRGMVLGIIGHRHTAGEFLAEKQQADEKEKNMQELNRELYSD